MKRRLSGYKPSIHLTWCRFVVASSVAGAPLVSRLDHAPDELGKDIPAVVGHKISHNNHFQIHRDETKIAQYDD